MRQNAIDQYIPDDQVEDKSKYLGSYSQWYLCSLRRLRNLSWSPHLYPKMLSLLLPNVILPGGPAVFPLAT
jgi:hypothetical protein